MTFQKRNKKKILQIGIALVVCVCFIGGGTLFAKMCIRDRYTPGSTFKLVTTLAFMRQNPDYNNYSFECNGEFSQNGATIHCYNSTAHGEELSLIHI